MKKLIKSPAEYEKALSRFEQIFHAPENTPDGDEAELLALLIESYENRHVRIDLPDPVAAIKFHMEQLGLKQADVAPLFGGKTRVSEVLNRKSPLTLKTIFLLNKHLEIPLNSLINEKANYKLASGKKAISSKLDRFSWALQTKQAS